MYLICKFNDDNDDGDDDDVDDDVDDDDDDNDDDDDEMLHFFVLHMMSLLRDQYHLSKNFVEAVRPLFL